MFDYSQTTIFKTILGAKFARFTFLALSRFYVIIYPSLDFLGTKFTRLIFLVSSLFYVKDLVIELGVHCYFALVFIEY